MRRIPPPADELDEAMQCSGAILATLAAVGRIDRGNANGSHIPYHDGRPEGAEPV